MELGKSVGEQQAAGQIEQSGSGGVVRIKVGSGREVTLLNGNLRRFQVILLEECLSFW